MMSKNVDMKKVPNRAQDTRGSLSEEQKTDDKTKTMTMTEDLKKLKTMTSNNERNKGIYGKILKKRKRTNGSARLKKSQVTRIKRWESQGISVGSINIAGVSLFKLYMLLESHALDVLCIQETWLTPSSVQLNIPGY